MNKEKCWLLVALICFVQQVDCLHLAVTPSHIEPGTTKNLIINCSLNVQSTTHLAQLNSLVLSRTMGVDRSDHHVVTSINSADGSVKVYTGDGVGSGLINNKGVSYLSVQWAFPFPDMAGHYICEAHGLALSMLPKTMVASVNISSRDLTFNSISHQLRMSKLENSLRVKENNLLIENVEVLQDKMMEKVKSLQDNISEKVKSLQVNMTEDVKSLQNDVIKSTQFVDKMKQYNLASLKTWFNASAPYNGRRYYLTWKSINLFTSELAQATCVQHGGYLAEIDDVGEFHFVRNFLKIHKHLYIVYISGTDEGHEDYWVSSRNNSAIKYINWYKAEPNGGSSANCLVLWQYGDWYMADNECARDNTYNNFGYLCEIVEQ